MERGSRLIYVDFLLSCILAEVSPLQPSSTSLVSVPACSFMQKATCISPIVETTCKIRYTDFEVFLSMSSGDDCSETTLGTFSDCLAGLRGISNYIGITDKIESSDNCVSGVDCRNSSNVCHTNCKDQDDFPRTSEGLVLMYLTGMLTGILITSFGFICYIRCFQTQSSKQDNTYLDLDLSVVDNDEKPQNYGQRGSVAFVREIASVYYNQMPEKERTTSTSSRIFSWASPNKTRQSIQERKSSLDIELNSNPPKRMFSYEQSVPEETHDFVDLDTPTTPLKDVALENKAFVGDKNKDNNNLVNDDSVNFADADTPTNADTKSSKKDITEPSTDTVTKSTKDTTDPSTNADTKSSTKDATEPSTDADTKSSTKDTTEPSTNADAKQLANNIKESPTNADTKPLTPLPNADSVSSTK